MPTNFWGGTAMLIVVTFSPMNRRNYRVGGIDVAPDRNTGHLAVAANDVAGIGSSLSSANAAAATPTTAVLAAAGDEVLYFPRGVDR
jgi:hypothetical protein